MLHAPNEFLGARARARGLARITEAVSPDLEICAVTDRVSKSPGGGPGLLFEHPTGFDIPGALNLSGPMRGDAQAGRLTFRSPTISRARSKSGRRRGSRPGCSTRSRCCR